MPHKHPSEHRPHAHRQHVHKPKAQVSKVAKKIPVLSRFGSREGRRFVEELWQKHKGEEIWILGTGPSMDDYPDDFFDDKIAIGLKHNIKIFPNCTFHLSTIGPHKPAILTQPKFLKKHIFGLRTQKPRFRIWVPEKYSQLPVFMWQYRIHAHWPAHQALLREAVDRIMHRKLLRYPIEDTVSQLGIHAAAIMGAKKITLVGCQEKCVDRRLYAERYRGCYGRRRFDVTPEKIKLFWTGGSRRRKATRILAKALKRYGVEVTLYHHKDSEQYKVGYLGMS